VRSIYHEFNRFIKTDWFSSSNADGLFIKSSINH
jgi:hypothetical protein